MEKNVNYSIKVRDDRKAAELKQMMAEMAALEAE